MKIEILFSEEQIAARVRALAAEIVPLYRGRPLTAVVLLNGGMLFGADLIRRLDLPLQYDTFAASSYRNDCSSGKLTIRAGTKLPVAGRDVLLLDDILDTGVSLAAALRYFLDQGAVSVRSCVLLDKKIAAAKPCRADFVGFECPDCYVVGYGLDSQEGCRNLPYVGVVTDPA